MGGHQKQRPALLQFLQNGYGNPHAFHRVRAGPEFIHNHQALRGHFPQNIQHIHNMGRKGGQIFRQILAVADIAENVPVHADFCLLAGNMQSALRHQTAQRHGFDGHGLPSGVGSGYHNTVYTVSQGKLQGHTGIFVHQGMSCILQENPPFPDDLRFPAIIALREFSLGKNKVQLFHHPDILCHDLPILRNQSAEFIQNPPYFVFLVHPQFLQLFIILCRCGRFYKQCASRGGFVDQDPADPEFIFFFHRNAHMSVPYGAEMV